MPDPPSSCPDLIRAATYSGQGPRPVPADARIKSGHDGDAATTAAASLRHPEKAHRPDNPVPRKPDWLRVRAPGSPEYLATRRLMREWRLNTVCEEAERVGAAVAALGLAHVVVTSVDRDDLDDGGAGHFAATIAAIRAAAPVTTIEVLVPDFLRKDGAIETVVAARPDVLNHNLETVPRLYAEVRPGARYFASLRLLDQAKRIDPAIFTKSGMMVGLGEERAEVLQVMDDLRAAEVDFLTIGQYLQPTPKHH